MPTIAEVIKRLFPLGTNPDRRDIRSCPAWPPDLFAIAATLLDRSSFYAQAPFTAPWDRDIYVCNPDYVAGVEKIAANWSDSSLPPDELQQLWTDLLAAGGVEIVSEKHAKWKEIALRLMTIADQVSRGIGFAPPPENRFNKILLDQLEALISGSKRKRILPYAPSSLCVMISNQELCVQPKTNAPGVGCTVRSFSHNLALLPSVGVVATSWLFMHPAEISEKPFNLLLVPYPFVVSARDFSAVSLSDDEKSGFFSYRAGWVDKQGRQASPRRIADALCILIKAASREADQVHGVVLPETALTKTQAIGVARELARRNKGLELFVSGIIEPATKTKNPRNAAFTARLFDGIVLDYWSQSKHHRWGLDSGQVVRYHLGSVLDPSRNWWEKIDVSNRTCVFTVVRPGASLCVLVCEDLARFDPVMPVINAIGPNLVIALLMDGPQLERRWPGRYATVLADDPGSSVLTLTSLGMLRRSTMPGKGRHRHIALWKQSGSMAQELRLPEGHHGLLLSLAMTLERQVTLDQRSDNFGTRRFVLSGARGVKFDSKLAWLQLD